MITAIEACTDTKVEAVVGKPSHYMADAVLHRLNKQPEDCLMIGDRLETDVLLGLNAGMAAALTLTGATDESILKDSPIKPTYIIRQLADLLPENN
jgi:NagD protein